jgi:hypothetical protein
MMAASGGVKMPRAARGAIAKAGMGAIGIQGAMIAGVGIGAEVMIAGAGIGVEAMTAAVGTLAVEIAVVGTLEAAIAAPGEEV